MFAALSTTNLHLKMVKSVDISFSKASRSTARETSGALFFLLSPSFCLSFPRHAPRRAAVAFITLPNSCSRIRFKISAIILNIRQIFHPPPLSAVFPLIHAWLIWLQGQRGSAFGVPWNRPFLSPFHHLTGTSWNREASYCLFFLPGQPNADWPLANQSLVYILWLTMLWRGANQSHSYIQRGLVCKQLKK